MDKKKKELILFYVLLAIIGSISGASVGSRSSSTTLSFRVVETLFCGSLVVPVVFLASHLVLACRPQKVHEEMLSKFGGYYRGAILFSLSFWATSTAIRVGLSVAANAILPYPMVSGALTLGVIGGIVPVMSFFITHCVIIPIVEKVNHCIIEPVIEKVRERIYSKKVELHQPS